MVRLFVGWVVGGLCGGVGLLFGNCIVNASILQDDHVREPFGVFWCGCFVILLIVL